jgi:hypothetical protein
MNASLNDFFGVTNGQAVALEHIPVLRLESLHAAVSARVAAGCRVSALFGAASPQPGVTRLYAVLADDEQNRLSAAAADVANDPILR